MSQVSVLKKAGSVQPSFNPIIVTDWDSTEVKVNKYLFSTALLSQEWFQTHKNKNKTELTRVEIG